MNKAQQACVYFLTERQKNPHGIPNPVRKSTITLRPQRAQATTPRLNPRCRKCPPATPCFPASCMGCPCPPSLTRTVSWTSSQRHCTASAKSGRACGHPLRKKRFRPRNVLTMVRVCRCCTIRMLSFFYFFYVRYSELISLTVCLFQASE